MGSAHPDQKTVREGLERSATCPHECHRASLRLVHVLRIWRPGMEKNSEDAGAGMKPRHHIPIGLR